MEDAGIYAEESAVLGRAVQLGIAGGQVISVSFPERVPDDAEPDHDLLDRVFAYLRGADDDFEDVPLAITVPTDQRRVLEAVQQVPYGETVSARQVAHVADLDPDDEADADRVRTALRNNPVPLFVPDHRVTDAPGATPSDVAKTLRDIES